jgi:NTP pyrophosphatase (non-canonical NTP hydrolase)
MITEFETSAIRNLQRTIHYANVDAGWWDDVVAGRTSVDAQVPTKLCLIHSEISEAMEGHRKQLMDDKLPHRNSVEVELADAIIRILDLAGALEFDLASAIEEKFQFNQSRNDHSREARSTVNGKRY